MDILAEGSACESHKVIAVFIKCFNHFDKKTLKFVKLNSHLKKKNEWRVVSTDFLNDTNISLFVKYTMVLRKITNLSVPNIYLANDISPLQGVIRTYKFIWSNGHWSSYLFVLESATA